MKKTIMASAIAAATAAALAVPAANASVVIYGKVHVSIDNIDADYISSGGQWQVKSRASRIGFKGTEDLGNGLSLIWKAETQYDFADGENFNAGRNAYIGLAGDWGTFLYGRHDTPYKIAYYSAGVEMMADTIIDFGDSQLSDLDISRVRASNAIAYISPNMNGLTFAAAVVAGENRANGADSLTDAYSLAAMYSNNGLKVAVAYENMDDYFNGDDTKYMITAGYTMNAFTIAGLYQDYEDDRTMLISGKFAMGNTSFIAKYGNTDWDAGGDSTMWGVGAEHKLSKRTSAYIAYRDEDAYDSLDDASAFSVGMIHNF